MPDHCSHVELLYTMQIMFAMGQRETMALLNDNGDYDETIRILNGMIDDLESKLRTVQNGDGCKPQLENTRGRDDGN